ncbi:MULTISPECIES: hypothetical protein [unclassified Pseudomonas]|uniref:hypothetical protein n=1 Tax=unclassified Pseudomonas TaxID=196821 RepID=UPI0015A0B610|nr:MULTISPECIES: hypothetical protein [unclassified Pseudomonas]NWC92634.1 hypothetical protein [Pseudomonas sp. IPO3779]NWD15631.1 hypothetical protein [Pseudomonas sp. IPO3778]
MASPLDISVRANVKELSKALSALAYKQIGFATAQALTALAKEVQADEIQNIASTFKKPRPFTQKSVGVQGARKDTLKASVFVRPIAAKYLEPYEDGGNHVLPGTSKAILNPKDIKLDQYGQLPRGVLDRLKARKDIFIGPVKTKSGIVNGVWQRVPPKNGKGARRGRAAVAALPGHLKLLIRFGDSLAVNKRLNYRSRAKVLVDRRFNAVFGEAMAKALASAR